MQLSDKDIECLLLVCRFLDQGTFTLKGVDAIKFVEARLWLKEFMNRNQSKDAPKVEPIAKPIAKPLRKKKKNG